MDNEFSCYGELDFSNERQPAVLNGCSPLTGLLIPFTPAKTVLVDDTLVIPKLSPGERKYIKATFPRSDSLYFIQFAETGTRMPI
jgi:hypothetical protein